MRLWHERLAALASGKLVLVHLAILICAKVLLPFAGIGVATITEPLSLFDATAVVAATNGARSEFALAPLRQSPVLDAAARMKLADMASSSYFAHVSPAGAQPWDWITRAGYTWRTAGENLARGFSSPSAAVAAWIQSPPHRVNILNSAYRDTGVAVGRITVRGRVTTVIVQLFGAPRGEPVRGDVSTSAATQGPIAAPVPVGTQTASISHFISATLVLWLLGLFLALLVGVAWGGPHPSTRSALAYTLVLLALTVLVPMVPAARGLIY